MTATGCIGREDSRELVTPRGSACCARFQAGDAPVDRVEERPRDRVVAVAAYDRRAGHRQLEWWFHPHDGDHRDPVLTDSGDVGGREVHRVGRGLELGAVRRVPPRQRVAVGRSPLPSLRRNRFARGRRRRARLALLRAHLHCRTGHSRRARVFRCAPASRVLGFFGVVRVELRNRHDAVIELESEHRLRDGANVAHCLLRRFAVVGEDVHFDRSTNTVADDAHRQDAAEPAEFLFELLELKWPLPLRLWKTRQSAGHSTCVCFRPSRGPVPAMATQDTADRTTLRGNPAYVTNVALVKRAFRVRVP